jgi:hypothetical protein
MTDLAKYKRETNVAAVARGAGTFSWKMSFVISKVF